MIASKKQRNIQQFILYSNSNASSLIFQIKSRYANAGSSARLYRRERGAHVLRRPSAPAADQQRCTRRDKQHLGSAGLQSAASFPLGVGAGASGHRSLIRPRQQHRRQHPRARWLAATRRLHVEGQLAELLHDERHQQHGIGASASTHCPAAAALRLLSLESNEPHATDNVHRSEAAVQSGESRRCAGVPAASVAAGEEKGKRDNGHADDADEQRRAQEAHVICAGARDDGFN